MPMSRLAIDVVGINGIFHAKRINRED